MRLHRNLVFAVVDALSLIFNEGEYADKVVEKTLKKDIARAILGHGHLHNVSPCSEASEILK